MRMNRIVTITAMIVVFTLILTGCAGNLAKNDGTANMAEESNASKEVEENSEGSIVDDKSSGNAAEEINANSNLPMALLTPYEDVRESLEQDDSLDFINNFMSADYYADSYMLSFAGFPEDDSPYCLTTIELTDGQYDICGVKVGGDIAQGAQTLEKHGFVPEGSSYEFVKDSVVISLSDDGSGVVEEISVAVPSEYTSGNLY